MNKIAETQAKYFEALIFATSAHGPQLYDKDKPYIFHLANVNQTLVRFGYSIDKDIIYFMSGILHDVVEDTDVKLKEIRSRFGNAVADIVRLVTDKEGETREERHRNTYPLLATNKDAIIIKLADRITNVEYSEFTSNLKQWRKYRREYQYFRDTLKLEDHIEAAPMWEHLDKLFDYGDGE
jgi:(p)ppGpp synthase/HD superfamily hydrolase